MALTLQHGSRSQRSDNNAIETNVVWQGVYSEVIAFRDTLVIGSIYTGLGKLSAMSLAQGEGVIWELTLTYSRTRSDGSSGDDPDEAAAPTEQKLSVRTVSVPIEAHFNYSTNWNHYLIGRCIYTGTDYTAILPLWWDTATTPYLSPTGDGRNYRWVKTLSEVPQPTRTEQWGIVSNGTTVCRPQKPGVTNYDKALYVITETGYHETKTQAGWAAATAINSIVASPLLGNFGLGGTGYNWKVDEVSVEFDGERWVASRTYTMSGDSNGWDSDIY